MYVAMLGDELLEPAARPSPPKTVAIFGASGTAGDGILAAALADPGVETLRVITRRITPRLTFERDRLENLRHGECRRAWRSAGLTYVNV